MTNLSKIITDLSNLSPEELAKLQDILSGGPQSKPKRKRTRKNKQSEQPSQPRKRTRKKNRAQTPVEPQKPQRAQNKDARTVPIKQARSTNIQPHTEPNKFLELEPSLNKKHPINSKEYESDRKIAQAIKKGTATPLAAFGGERPNGLVEITCRGCNQLFEVSNELIWKDAQTNSWVYDCNSCQVKKGRR